jgi:3-deoxy-D-manno-octulosonic-acid transferase
VAASTHEGEEAHVLDAHVAVRSSLPEALLFLVPRHPERFASVADLLASRGVRFSRRSAGAVPSPEDEVFLVDTLGDLPMFYAAADLAFVAGSLVPIGGHNLLEPAALGKPVLAGPHNFNAEDLATLLEEAGALEIVPDAPGLAAAVVRLLSDDDLRRARGQKALRAVAENGGALDRLMGLIEPLLAP